jgi:hypothetical protein
MAFAMVLMIRTNNAIAIIINASDKSRLCLRFIFSNGILQINKKAPTFTSQR